jgi:hypothetical protein
LSAFQLSDTLIVPAVGGRTYRLRYRAKNFNGWGEFSEIAYKLAAQRPPKPYAPVYVSSDEDSVTLRLETPENDSGAEITYYNLYRDVMSFGVG